MGDEFLTQRDFAALTGLSTATVVKRIKNGTITRASSGRIPKSEVIKTYIDRIKKYAEYGTLVITFDKDEDELELLKQHFLSSSYVGKLRDTIRCYSGVRDIIGVVTKPNTSVDAKTVQEQYNKEVLNLFMQKYCQVVDSYFVSLASNGMFKSFSALSVSDAYDYLMFGKFFNVTDASSSFLADAVAVKEINQYVQVRFNSIMTELCLVGQDGSSLFTRDALCKEFFNKEGDLYNSFFFNSNGQKEVVFLTQSQKVVDSLIKSANGRRTKATIDTVLSDGFVSIINVDSSCVNLLQSTGSYVEGDVLSEACCGAYSRVIVNKSATELASCTENGLCVLPMLLQKTSSASVVYDDSL